VTNYNLFRTSGQRRNAEWTHFERWRDYVSDLYTLANKELSRGIYTTIPLPHDSRQPYDPNSTIFVWHIPSFDGRVTRKMVSLNDYHGICWKHINLGWEQRVRQMCQDVEESRGQSYVLVEGILCTTRRGAFSCSSNFGMMRVRRMGGTIRR
jgi:hypothetical protein